MKKYSAFLALASAITYYYLISVAVDFKTFTLQLILAILIVLFTVVVLFMHSRQEKVLPTRGITSFFLLCATVSIITTNIALLSMFCIGAAYYLTYGNTAGRKFLKHFIILSGFCFIAVLLLCIMGALPNITTAIYYMPEISKSVSSLGFKNPNGVLMFLLPIVAAVVLYVFNEKSSKRYSVLLALLFTTATFFGISGSRNGLIITTLVILAGLIDSSIWHKIYSLLRKISPMIFGFFAVLSFILVLVFGKDWGSLVNRILSFRPSKMFEGVSDFIKNPVWISNSEVSGFPVDNLYIFIALSYGILILICYALVFWWLFRAERNIGVVVVGILMLLYGVFEKFTMIPVINIFMPLAMISLLNAFGNKSIKNKVARR